MIVVEGHSDAAFFEWLSRRSHLSLVGPNVGVLDAGGKYELHRAVSVLSLFQIPHVVVWDEDAAMREAGSWSQVQQKCRDDAAFEALKAAAADASRLGETPSPVVEPAPADEDPILYEEIPYSYQVELDEKISDHPSRSALLGGVRLNGTIEKWLGIDQERENPWKASNLAMALEEAFAASSSAVPGSHAASASVLR